MPEEAFIYEAIRTPRGRQKNGSLHEVKPLSLVVGLIEELRKRNPNPRFLQNHHQWLRKFGRDKVQAQIAANVALMRNCETMDDFRRMFTKAFGKYGDITQLTLDWGE